MIATLRASFNRKPHESDALFLERLTEFTMKMCRDLPRQGIWAETMEDARKLFMIEQA